MHRFLKDPGAGPVLYSQVRFRLGTLLAARIGPAITDIDLSAPECEKGFIRRLEAKFPGRGLKRGGDFTGLSEALTAWARGAKGPELDLYPLGTPFDLRVWRSLLGIPRGGVISYGELASRAGSPGGARAAGGACSRNPLPVVVPCHRVVRSDGSLGGYSGGVEVKRELLKVEGVVL